MPKLLVTFDHPRIVRKAKRLTITVEAGDAEVLKAVPRRILMEGTAYDALTTTGDLREIEKDLRDAIEMELGLDNEVSISIEDFDEEEHWVRTIETREE